MKVILLKAVQKVGKKDDVVEVSEGYARNALLPTKIMSTAMTKNLFSLRNRFLL
jgi:large subunit ribosomal protein L9